MATMHHGVGPHLIYLVRLRYNMHLNTYISSLFLSSAKGIKYNHIKWQKKCNKSFVPVKNWPQMSKFSCICEIFVRISTGFFYLVKWDSKFAQRKYWAWNIKYSKNVKCYKIVSNKKHATQNKFFTPNQIWSLKSEDS